ncbi:MAG: DUF4185 domain-containing protein [Cyclobacteriaceae bacterium]
MLNVRTQILFTLFFLVSFYPQSQSLLGPRVENAPEWDQLFIRNNGWFGGDGIFAIPLDGKEHIPAKDDTETLFIFSDTMIGKFEGQNLQRDEFSMIHNSVALLQGSNPVNEKIKFYWPQKDNGAAQSIFVPNTPNAGSDDYYWLGDGFVNIDHDSTLYIFAYRIIDLHDGVYPFQQVGVSLIAIPKGDQPPFKEQRQLDTPFFTQTELNGAQTSFGAAIYVNTASAGAPNPDGYIYVYAIRGVEKELLVARIQPQNFTKFEQWRFWNGQRWDESIASAAPITKYVSNEMSVSSLPDGRLILAYQFMTANPEIAVQQGASPIGPFHPMKKIWRTQEAGVDLDFFTYNAKAHPHLSPPGSLLISYNVNSFDFWNDILNKPNLYRPRFIQLKLD